MVITFKNTPIINTPLTLCQKSYKKYIKKDLKRRSFLHNVNHHVIRNDDIYTLKDRSLANADEYEMYSLLERNDNKKLNILSRYPK